MTTTLDYTPDYATPPGFTLDEALEDLAMSQAELSRRTGLSTKHVNQIIQGHVAITNDTALRLERVTGIPARLWNNLESRYQEHRLRLKEESQLEGQLHFLDLFPIKAMVAMGLLTKRAPKVDRLRELLSFFGVANPKALDVTWAQTAASFRTSRTQQSNDGAVAVWLRLGDIAASTTRCASWDPALFRTKLAEARTLTCQTDPAIWQPLLVEKCAEAGVVLAIVPEVPGAKMHGAARWLTHDRAHIQLSLRYRWTDIFWFSFFHEAKHVLDEAKRSILVEETSSAPKERPEEEIAADNFAADLLIPPPEVPELLTLRTFADVGTFADRLDIHVGIVVGRLQHEGVWPHSKGNSLRQRLGAASSMA